jgi:hypothetical protein
MARALIDQHLRKQGLSWNTISRHPKSVDGALNQRNAEDLGTKKRRNVSAIPLAVNEVLDEGKSVEEMPGSELAIVARRIRAIRD